MQLKRENQVKKIVHTCQNNYTNGVQGQVFDLWPDLRNE